MWHKFLFGGNHILYFHLWPFVTVEERERCARFFGRLELPGNFCRRKWIIDAVAALAKLLDLCQRIGAALLLGDHNVDVDLAVVSDRLLHRFVGVGSFVH